jgi:hypothetical protein
LTRYSDPSPGRTQGITPPAPIPGQTGATRTNGGTYTGQAPAVAPAPGTQGTTVAPQTVAPATPGYAGPPVPTLPSVQPTSYAGPGNDDSIAQVYSWETSKNYNNAKNQGLDHLYRQALENWELNGRRGPEPPPPQFLNVDYDKELAWRRSQTPTSGMYGQDTGYNLSPYLGGNSFYGNFVPTWNTGNTPLASASEPFGLAGPAARMIPQGEPTPTVGTMMNGGGGMPVQTAPLSTSNGQPGQSGQNLGQSGGQGQGNPLLALLALLAGSQGKPGITPSYNSLFYPQTSGQAPAVPQSQSNSNPMLALLSLLLGGR